MADQSSSGLRRPRAKVEIHGKEAPAPPVPPRPAVTIKGTAELLRVVVTNPDPSAAATALGEAIASRAGKFFEGAQVELELPGPALDTRLVQELAVVLVGAGMTLKRVETRPSTTSRRPRRSETPSASVAEGDELALIRRGTVRSGQRIVHAGSVIILGDVNPGAEVVAGGSIIVWGRLRGRAEAGLSGDAEACVCALDLAPSQLRIGNAIARAPDEPDRTPVPEVATLREGRIVVTAWS